MLQEVIGASSLYHTSDVKQGPYSIPVAPNVANGSGSTAAGDGLGIATAGTAAQLTIQAKDQ